VEYTARTPRVSNPEIQNDQRILRSEVPIKNRNCPSEGPNKYSQ